MTKAGLDDALLLTQSAGERVGRVSTIRPDEDATVKRISVSTPYYKLKDPQLSSWATATAALLMATPAAYYISAEQAATFSARADAFATKLGVWLLPATHTPVALEAKNQARLALLEAAKYIVGTITNNFATTDEQRRELGINPRKQPTPIPVPTPPPQLDVLSVVRRTVTMRVHSGAGVRKTKAFGAAGANVWTYYGPVPPTDLSEWHNEGLVTRTKFELTFDQESTAGTAWATAYWFSETGKAGMGCAPVQINLPAVTQVPGAGAMKIAA